MAPTKSGAPQPGAPTNLHAKIARIAASLGAIKKDGTAPDAMGGFKFISHGALMGHLRNELADANIAIVPRRTTLLADEVVTLRSSSKEREVRRVVIEIAYDVVNGDEPADAFSATWLGEGIDATDKAIQKAITSADKYFLSKLFKVSDKDDPDGADPVAGEGSGEEFSQSSPARPAAPPLVPEGLDDQQWAQLGALAKSVPAEPWKPQKVRARLDANGGALAGFHEVLAELVDAHKHACGPDCEHVAAAFPQEPAQQPTLV